MSDEQQQQPQFLPAQVNGEHWAVNMIKTLGFPTVVACVLMWAFAEQIGGLREDVTESRAYIRGTLTEQLKRSNEVIDQSNRLGGQNQQLMQQIIDRLERDRDNQ